jgi:hypothetical protein
LRSLAALAERFCNTFTLQVHVIILNNHMQTNKTSNIIDTTPAGFAASVVPTSSTAQHAAAAAEAMSLQLPGAS